MTQDEMIELAKPFLWGGNVVEGWTFSSYEQLEAFANLIAEKEREACAEIAESQRHSPHFQLTSMPPQNGTAVSIANAIRARGQA